MANNKKPIEKIGVNTTKVGDQDVPLTQVVINGEKVETTVPLSVLSEMVNRANLAARVGLQTYDGQRNIYQALGYPDTIQKTDYYPRYKRQDMAKAVIDRPVKASWKGDVHVVETNTPSTTPFEQGWIDLNKQFKGKLKNILMRCDKLTGLGRYSILFFGLDDVRKVEDYKNPVKKGAKLVYLKPLSEVSSPIVEYDINVNSPRYGLPLYYNISSATGDSELNNSTTSYKVHYTRVLHLVENILENESFGTPRLEAIWNRLLDLEKIVGGDAEMFWRGARPGYTGEVNPEYNMTTAARQDLQTQIDEYENNLRRILINDGVKYSALAQQIADPGPHVNVQVQMISAETTIPKRILVGSEMGELSSAQDKQEWISYVTARREEQNEPMILRPFIDMCLELSILPPTITGFYIIVWDKLFSLSDKEKAEVGRIRAMALREFSTNPNAMKMVPMPMMLEHYMGFDSTQIDKFTELQQQMPPIVFESEEGDGEDTETSSSNSKSASEKPTRTKEKQKAQRR